MAHSQQETNGRDSEPGMLANHDRLRDWVLHNGGYFHPNVEIAHSEDSGYHVVAAKGKTVTPRTRVSSCPMGCTLSIMNVLDIAPFPNRGTGFPKKFIEENLDAPELLQTFYLMEQAALGDKSWWAPYIKTIPTVDDVNGLQFDTEEDAQFIKGTNLENGYRDLITRWRGYYDKGLSDLESQGWPEAKCSAYTWELFRWAASIFGSRGFSSVVLADTTPAEEARLRITKDPAIRKLFSDRFAVLLPLMDVLNHKPKIKVDWQPRTGYVGLQVHDTYQEGEQLFNNYGPKDNESLLLSYGFVSDDKSFQHVALSIQPPPGTLLDITRKFQLDGRSNIEHKLYLLNVEHFKTSSATCLEVTLFDYDLLETVSVLVANERESSNMLATSNTLMSTGLARQHAFDDFRNLLAVIGQILMHCETGRKRLIDTKPKITATTAKQINANLLRQQQIGIYEDALLLGKLILAQACHADSSFTLETLLSVFGNEYSPQPATNISALLTRFHEITRPEELFTVPKLLSMLPATTQPTLRRLIQDIEKHIRSVIDTSTASTSQVPTIELSQIRLALVIAAAQHAYTRGLKIAPRLADWLERVTAWYPPNDPNWSFVPTDGPWQMGEDPPKVLQWLLNAGKGVVREIEGGNGEAKGLSEEGVRMMKQWLKPKGLCWAFNVLYEEGVQVPGGVLRVVESGTGERKSKSGTDAEEGQDREGSPEGMEMLLYMQSQ